MIIVIITIMIIMIIVIILIVIIMIIMMIQIIYNAIIAWICADSRIYWSRLLAQASPASRRTSDRTPSFAPG